MTGIERLRELALVLGQLDMYEYAEELRGIVDQVERETLPRPRFEDGEPVNVGDTFSTISGEGYRCDGYRVYQDGTFDLMNEKSPNCWYAPSYRRDERVKRPIPEPPDTWERIEADAHKEPCDYFGAKESRDCGEACPMFDEDASCVELMGVDLVRRCKALAVVD